MKILDTISTVEKINLSLQDYSDKDWNYTRITLVSISLRECYSPYVLWCEFLDRRDKEQDAELKSVESELKWGDRHSSELGILELISLRLNKALFESTSDEYWDFLRPVIRLTKRETLINQGIETGLFYQVIEVAGENFENR